MNVNISQPFTLSLNNLPIEISNVRAKYDLWGISEISSNIQFDLPNKKNIHTYRVIPFYQTWQYKVFDGTQIYEDVYVKLLDIGRTTEFAKSKVIILLPIKPCTNVKVAGVRIFNYYFVQYLNNSWGIRFMSHGIRDGYADGPSFISYNYTLPEVIDAFITNLPYNYQYKMQCILETLSFLPTDLIKQIIPTVFLRYTNSTDFFEYDD